MSEVLETAIKAVEIYATRHPRPCQVTQKQAAEMLRISPTTINIRVKSGQIKLNGLGMIPISEIDRLIAG